MSRVPDFAGIDLASGAPRHAAVPLESWLTPEAIPVKSTYGAAERAGIETVDR